MLIKIFPFAIESLLVVDKVHGWHPGRANSNARVVAAVHDYGVELDEVCVTFAIRNFLFGNRNNDLQQRGLCLHLVNFKAKRILGLGDLNFAVHDRNLHVFNACDYKNTVKV